MTPRNNQFLFSSLKAVSAVFFLSAFALMGCADLLERGGELAVFPKSTYVVKFDTGSGSKLDSRTITAGGLVAKPANPSRGGYTFGGWYTDQGFSNAFSFTAAITENLTLYAKWNLLTDRGDFNTLKAAGNNSPQGLWSDGTTMWVVDDEDDKIYAYNLSTKARDADKDFNTLKAAGNTYPLGIWSDGVTMWVANNDSWSDDRNNDKIYAYRMSDKQRDRAKDFNTLKVAGNRYPDGIWSDGTTMWVADLLDRKLYAYRLIDKAKDLNTLSVAGNNGPTEIWSDGTTMWVVDDDDGKIYAYRLSDQARDPAKDFNPLKAAGNAYATGIWSDGTTRWVADYDDGKIYAYYTISFEVNGGSAVSSQKVAHGTRATKPSDPNRSGYVFQGWYTDPAFNNAFSFNTAITGSPTLYAKWGKVHTITFITNTATPSAPAFAVRTVGSGGKATRPADPTRSGSFIFTDWYTDRTLNNAFDFSTAITANLTLYAKWLTTYRVSFITNTAIPSAPTFATTNIVQGGKVIRPADPTRSGYAFLGWYTDQALNNAFNFNTTITGNITLYARWLTAYRVSFVTNVGNPNFAVQTVRQGSNAVDPSPAPKRFGYDFGGWYKDAAGTQLFSFSAAITANLTLYAKWRLSRHALTFEMNGATPALPVQNIYHGSRATEPKDPALAGRTFKGWFVSSSFSGSAFNFANPIIGNTTLHAKWERITYRVTFEMNGATPALPVQNIYHGSRATEPKNPTLAGHTFKGWFVSSSFSGSTFNFANPITANLRLYAKWTAVPKVSGDFNTLKAAGNNRPTGLWSDGTTMWVADDEDDKIYAYNLRTKARDSSKDFNTLAAGNAFPKGLWSDGTTMWVADLLTARIYAYNLRTKARDSSKDFNITTGNNLHRGLWSDGTTMWVVGGTPGSSKELYAYKLSTKARDSSKDFNLTANNKNPQGLWSDGTTMWVVDDDDGKIYAYRLSDQARDPAKDFNPLKAAGNAYATGIWSDGTTRWVADYDDGKIYAYYTISFEVNGGSAVSSQKVAHGTRATQPSDPNRSGYVFGGWYTDPAFNNAFSFNTAITGSPTLYAKWSKVHTITFITNTATPSAPAFAVQTVGSGGKVTAPADPTRSGSFIFTGWYTDQALNNKFTFATDTITENTTLYAGWRKNSYVVTFELNGGTGLGQTNLAHGEKITTPTAPKRSGFVFDGWYANAGFSTAFNFNTAITGSITLYARWLTAYRVSFITNSKTPSAPAFAVQTVGSGKQATKPDKTPTRTGHFFVGWFTTAATNTVFNFDTARITANTVVYAGWGNSGVIATFNSGGGSAVAEQRITYGTKATRPAANPTRSGYTFLGWYATAGAITAATPTFNFDTALTGNTTIYAKWIKTYAVTFVTNVGNPNLAVQTVSQGSNAVAPSPAPTRFGYDFGGWYKDTAGTQSFSFTSEPIAKDTTLYAKWRQKRYAVTFVTNRGAPNYGNPQTVNHGSRPTQPSDPAQPTGFTFGGWYANSDFSGNKFNFATDSITAATTLYAKWTLSRQVVTFEMNGGTPALPVQNIDYGSRATEPKNPTLDGYGFKGWFVKSDLSGSAFNFSTAITANLKLYAKWAKLYPVSYVTNKGAVWSNQRVASGSRATKPSDPTLTGFTFEGWFTTAATNVAFNFNNAITGPTTVYAAWTRSSYTVAFNSGGGSAVAAQQVLYTNRATKPGNPTRSAYTFGGWYADRGLTQSFNFGTAITGNRTLYAKWTAVTTVGGDFNTLIAAQNFSPIGLWSDGTTMWVTDSYRGKIYAYRLSDKQRDPAKDFNTLKAAGNNYPLGLWSDGTTMWVSDHADDKLHAYRLSDKQRDPAKDFNTLKAAGNSGPHGLWSDGVTMWVSDPDDDKLYAYRMSDKARDSAKDFNPLAAGNTSPVGIWSDGVTMWVSDPDDDKLYAYRMSDKARDSAKDFNTFPRRRGIWSDGVTMWVSGSSKISAYDMKTKAHTPTAISVTTPIHTVTFNPGGGSAVSPQSVRKGSSATQPSNPTRSGYTFGGWYTDAAFNNAFSFSTAITADTTLYAKWTRNTYKVTFNSGGGSAVAAQTITHGEKATIPSPAPTRFGYDFGGWYKDAAGTQSFNFNAETITAATTLYAKWMTPYQVADLAVRHHTNFYGEKTTPTLTWKVAAGSSATAQELWWGATAGGMAKIADLTANARSYTVPEAKVSAISGQKTYYLQLKGTKSGATTASSAVYPVPLHSCGAPQGGFTMVCSTNTLERINTKQVDSGGNIIGSYKLQNDLDLGGKVYTNSIIAFNTAFASDWRNFNGKPFKGVFDGNGKTIKNGAINAKGASSGTGRSFVGVFGQVASGGVVSNLGVALNVSGWEYVGGVVGDNSGILKDLHTTGVVSGSLRDDYDPNRLTYGTGGVVGINSGTVSGVYSTGKISGGGFVGGVVGWNRGTVSYSHSTGAVSGHSGVGGLAGINVGTVSGSYATGAVTAASSRVGGLVGWNNGTVSDSYATGAVSGRSIVGGLVGGFYGGPVSNGYATGNITRSSGSDSDFGYVVGDGSISDPLVNLYYRSGTSLPAGAGNPGSPVAVDFSTLTAANVASRFVGFDFSSVWKWSATLNRPVLRNMPPGAEQ